MNSNMVPKMSKHRSQFFQNILSELNVPKSYSQLKKSKSNQKDKHIYASKIQKAFKQYQRRKLLHRVKMVEQFIDKTGLVLDLDQSNASFQEILIERLLLALNASCSQLQLVKQQNKELKDMIRRSTSENNINQNNKLNPQDIIIPIQQTLNDAVREIRSSIYEKQMKVESDKLCICLDNIINLVEQL